MHISQQPVQLQRDAKAAKKDNCSLISSFDELKYLNVIMVFLFIYFVKCY